MSSLWACRYSVYAFTAITKPNDCVYPYDFKEQLSKHAQQMKVEQMGSERQLLAFLLIKIYKLDPDFIVVRR